MASPISRLIASRLRARSRLRKKPSASQQSPMRSWWVAILGSSIRNWDHIRQALSASEEAKRLAAITDAELVRLRARCRDTVRASCVTSCILEVVYLKLYMTSRWRDASVEAKGLAAPTDAELAG